MNSIVKISPILLVIVLFSQCKKDEKGPIRIPDNNFLGALTELGIDRDGDGQISPAEAESVRSLNIVWKDISDLTGIEFFTNLDTLDCSWNQITSLYAGNNSKLRELRCSNNRLITLDVSKNTELTLLDCGINQLSELDLSGNPALTALICDANQLTGLDVSENTLLEGLICGYNLLPDLNVSNNIALDFLWCNNNSLTTLDVSNNSSLSTLYCGHNELTRLDISHNTLLNALWLNDMPSLNKVCVWSMPFPPSGMELVSTGSPNASFSTDCSK